ncbi:MAG: primosomal protein N' [Oscillospiraceae bacterium]|jgi:primosomal protein N' (replication factor Y)|nr:primosomal protein N' [Oscillospiraceae bacterium]
MPLILASVAVELSSYTFDKPYAYRIPEHLEQQAKPGCRVLVPFGAGNRKKQGIILSIGDDSPLKVIKPVLAVLDKAPLLNKELLELVPWLKGNTFCTLFEAAKALLPAGLNIRLRQEYQASEGIDEAALGGLLGERQRVLSYLLKCNRPIEKDTILSTLGLEEHESILEELAAEGYITRTDEAMRKVGDASLKMARLSEGFDEQEAGKLSPKQSSVIKLLSNAGAASVKELCYFTGAGLGVIANLQKKGCIEYFEQEVYRSPYEYGKYTHNADEIILTPEQTKAYNQLLELYNKHEFASSLLYGVTGSGKTSVFMKLIDSAVNENQGVIVMVPEIALTPQTLEKFCTRYGNKVAVMHSGLSIGQRLDEWKRVKNGDALIAVGTRSAIFAPFERLGLVIMDEEQEHTYKSEASPRYHARNVARFRCAYNKALLVLSSATPALESYYHAQNGSYSLCTLKERYGSAKLPQVELIDMKYELMAGNTSIISDTLRKELEENLHKGRQSILLLNRRGYNTFVGCRSCRHVISCPNCSISLTYHAANGRLMCHYCGYSQEQTEICPQCGEQTMKYLGLGTQKAEEELAKILPDAKILRMDADTTMARNAYDKKLSAFGRGEYDIMIGTQMVAKGLNFPKVTLVGILMADQAIYGDDFRSYEKAFSLLTQVVGRSGRGEDAGKAVIQTYSPQHSIISLAANQDYESFYKSEITVRKAMLYPPFADICMISFLSEEEELAKNAADYFLEELKRKILTDYQDIPIRTLGPSAPPISRLSGRFRYRLIIKCRNTAPLRELIALLLRQCGAQKEFNRVGLTADMNPL